MKLHYLGGFVWFLLPTEPRELAHEAPCLVTMLIILEEEHKHSERWYAIICNPAVKTQLALHTYCTLRGLDQAMSLVSFRPIRRPFNAPNVAPVVKAKRQKSSKSVSPPLIKLGSSSLTSHARASDGEESQFKASPCFVGTCRQDELVCVLKTHHNVKTEGANSQRPTRPHCFLSHLNQVTRVDIQVRGQRTHPSHWKTDIPTC